MPGIPMENSPSFIRTALAAWYASGGAAAVAPDFAANTLATIFGGTAGFSPGFWGYVDGIRLTVGNADFAGASGSLTYELRRDSATGTAIASLNVTLATALRGTALDGLVTAANDALARIKPTDKLFLVRVAGGTAFTTGEGTWTILARQKLQSRGA